MTTLYDPDLTQWLQLSGEYIGHVRPAQERAGWIIFLLDEVKAFLTPDEFESLLRDLRDNIDIRLDVSGESTQ